MMYIEETEDQTEGADVTILVNQMEQDVCEIHRPQLNLAIFHFCSGNFFPKISCYMVTARRNDYAKCFVMNQEGQKLVWLYIL